MDPEDLLEVYSVYYGEETRDQLRQYIPHKDFVKIVDTVAKINVNTGYQEEVVNIIENHNRARGFTQILESLIKAYEENYLPTAVPVFDSFKLTTLLYNYQQNKNLNSIIKNIGEMCNDYSDVGVVKQRIEYYMDSKINDALCEYTGKAAKVINASIKSGSGQDFVWKVIDVFEKYKTHLQYILGEFWDDKNQTLGNVRPNRLLSERAYQEVKKSKKPRQMIHNLMVKQYMQLYASIKDGVFAQKVSYDDLELLEQTEQFVVNMTKERDLKDRTIIENGFWDEFNRAINQGETFEEKSRYLRQYCRDVQKLMKDNAIDILVMHYA